MRIPLSAAGRFRHTRGMADEFLTTRWSLVLAAGGDGPQADAALERLCRDNWRPLYAYARRWGCTPEDAEDAVQGFMVSLLQRRSLTGMEAGRGKFRSWLLSGIRHHLHDVYDRAMAAKRGGGARIASLDAAAEDGYTALAVDTDTPETAFARVWAMEIMERARKKLAAECDASGKAAVFAALFPDTTETGVSYAELGQQLGLSETALRTLAMRLRRRWKELIRAELAQTVNSPEALEEEMAALRDALG